MKKQDIKIHIEMLREKYGNKIVPMIIPIYKDKQFIKLHNIFENIDEFRWWI